MNSRADGPFNLDGATGQGEGKLRTCYTNVVGGTTIEHQSPKNSTHEYMCRAVLAHIE